MRRIAIGNDFRVSWTLTQLGDAFDVVGKTFDIEVSTAYGVIVVNDVVAEGNVLSFNVPASGQVYTGNYDIRLHITDEQTGQKWRLEQCDAFTLVPCGECADSVEVVQLSSGIVYPSNGLNAYQLAVINGYTGTYDEWVNYYTKPIQMKSINGVPLSGNGEIEQPIQLSVWREYVMEQPLLPDGEVEEPDVVARVLRYRIVGEVDPDKTYYLRLMRKVRKTHRAGSGKKNGQSWKRRKSGWCAVSAAGSEIPRNRPIYRYENMLQNHLQYPINGKDGIVRYTDIYGNLSNLWPGLLLSMFRMYDDDDVLSFPYHKTSKRRFNYKIENLNEKQMWRFNYLGVALWEYNDEGKAVRQVSNVARLGIAYNPGDVCLNDENDENTWWAIP